MAFHSLAVGVALPSAYQILVLYLACNGRYRISWRGKACMVDDA